MNIAGSDNSHLTIEDEPLSALAVNPDIAVDIIDPVLAHVQGRSTRFLSSQ